MDRGATSASARRALAPSPDARDPHHAASLRVLLCRRCVCSSGRACCRSMRRLAAPSPGPARARRCTCCRRRSPPRGALPDVTPPRASERATVHLLVGCVMPELFGDTVRNTRRGARRQRLPRRRAAGTAECCGALALHAGDRDARTRGRRDAPLDALAPRPRARHRARIVVNAAGCGAMMKDWGELFADDPARAARRARSRAASATRPSSSPSSGSDRCRHGGPARRVAYHDPCHLAHAQGSPSRAAGAARCHSRRHARARWTTRISAAGARDTTTSCSRRWRASLVARKVAAIRASGADLVATANAGCALQLEAGLRAAGLDDSGATRARPSRRGVRLAS